MSSEKLYKFLQAYRTAGKGSPFSHTSKEPMGSYYLEKGDGEEVREAGAKEEAKGGDVDSIRSGDGVSSFLDVYCDCIEWWTNRGYKGLNMFRGNNGVPTITEKPGAYTPLRVDFDLKAPIDRKERQYTLPIIKRVVKMYQDLIKASVSDSHFDEEMLTCIVLEKSAPRVEKKDNIERVKDGFHLHFPFFVTEAWFQDTYLRERVSSQMIQENIWKDCQFEENVDKLIDPVARTQWLMYGSSKGMKNEPYLATKAFDSKLKVITLDKVFETQMVGRENAVEYYLPIFLSVRGCDDKAKLKPNVEDRRHTNRKRAKTKFKKRNEHDILADLKMIEDHGIIDMLSAERADNCVEWMIIGYALYNISQGSEKGLELWIHFSKKSPKFSDGECEDLWDKMEVRDMSMGTLLMHAKKDSPELYKKWREDDTKTLIDNCITYNKTTDSKIANIVYSLYKDRFKCASAKNDIWYEFYDHRWRTPDDCSSLKNLLETEVSDMVEERVRLKITPIIAKIKSRRNIALLESSGTQSDEMLKAIAKAKREEAKEIEDETKPFKDVERKIISKLQDVGPQEKVIRSCRGKFLDPLFLRKMDENRTLFVCENGVLDLEKGIFREGFPDDYMTFSCGLEYNPKYNWEDQDVKDVEAFFGKVHVDKEINKYFFKSTSICMEGGNVTKTFTIATGEGNGAKSVTYKFIEKVFGDYCIKFPREMIIMSRNSSSASAPRPELVRVRGRRMVIIQEIAKNETLNIGVIKDLTGNDTMAARDCFQKSSDMKEIDIQFSLILMCNEPPMMDATDQPTWNRVRLTPYESMFVNKKDLLEFTVPDKEDEQYENKRFHADPVIIKRLEVLTSAFLWILFENYKEYKKNGLDEPDKVKNATNEYRKRNDMYVRFQDACVEKTEGNEFLSIKTLYENFNKWFTEENTFSKAKYTRDTLKLIFNKIFKQKAAREEGSKSRLEGWLGYKIYDDTEYEE